MRYEDPRPPNYGKWIFWLLVLLAGCWVAWHPVHAELTRDNPPVSCQLAGGTWNMFTGWSCG